MEAIISPAERFQNDTLRPILKAQNDLLVVLFQHHLRKRKADFENFSPEGRTAHIEQTIRKDLNFRSLLLGTIVGQLTTAQFETYILHENELSRRIINLLIQRLQSQLVK